MKTITLVYFLFAFGISWWTTTYAAEYAVLVGVGDYIQAPLAGPINDVTVMQRVLENKWGFKTENIAVLLNEQGTKKNILSAIANLYTKSKPGDQIFIFLSGHGTSASDEDLEIPLPTTTGAFIPFDIAGVKTTQELLSHLIIGREDIRPLLEKLDKGNRNIFVAIDACYSGNTVRGAFKKNKLQKRFMNLSQLVPRSAFEKSQIVQSDTALSHSSSTNQTYPYQHVYYLSASGEHEPAQDIPPEMVAEYPTIDGKPHGAFSDTLLRILNNNIDSDINKDGTITYSELKQTLRSAMSARGFEHSPQGLPTLIDDKNNLGKRPLFGISSAKGLKLVSSNSSTDKIETHSQKNTSVTISDINIPQGDSSEKLTLTIDPSLPKLIQQTKQSNFVTLVDNQPDIEVRRLNSDVLLISKAGDLVASLSNPDVQTMMFNIAHQAWIHQIIHQPFAQQFNLDIEMIGNGRGGTAVEGELVGFSIKSTEDAYILLLDIDSQGTINVIYPYTTEELKPMQANTTLRLNEISEVAAPFGRDSIQVYAFKESTTEYESLRGKNFILGSADASKLERLIYADNLQKARASMELVTIKRNQ